MRAGFLPPFGHPWSSRLAPICGLPKFGVPASPNDKDSSIGGCVLGSLDFGNYHMRLVRARDR